MLLLVGVRVVHMKGEAMKHEQFQELVSSFIDRELEAGRERELFVHLGDCPECREFLKASLSLQRDVFATKPAGAPSLDLKRVSVPTVQIWRRSVPFPIAAIIAIVALASTIAFGTLWMRPKEKPSEITQEVVYVQRLPAIQVIGFYPPDGQSKK